MIPLAYGVLKSGHPFDATQHTENVCATYYNSIYNNTEITLIRYSPHILQRLLSLRQQAATDTFLLSYS